VPQEGDDLVVVASGYADRDSMLWYDPYGPFLDVHDGINTWSDWSNRTPKVRLGYLNGAPNLSDGTSPSGYGLYGENVYLEGTIVANSGKIADSVTIGGTQAKNLAADSDLFSGDYNDLTGTPTLGDVASLNDIDSTYISDGAVVTAKIASGAITTTELSADAVTATEIAIGSVTDIDSDAATINDVFSGNYSDLSGKPTLGDVASLNDISSTYISDGAVVTRTVASNAITTSELKADAVTATEISIGSVTDIDTDAATISDVFSGDYGDLDGTPTLGDVASLNNISSTYISDGAVVTSKLSAGAVSADKVAANAITASEADLDSLRVSNNVGASVDTWNAYVSVNTDRGLYSGFQVKIDKNNNRVYISQVGQSGSSEDYEFELEVFGSTVTGFTDLQFNNSIDKKTDESGNTAEVDFDSDESKWGTNGVCHIEGTNGVGGEDEGYITLDKIDTSTSFELRLYKYNANGETRFVSLGDRIVSTNPDIPFKVQFSPISAGDLVFSGNYGDLSNTPSLGDVASLDDIDSTHIANGAVVTETIASNAITTSELSADAVTATEISIGSVKDIDTGAATISDVFSGDYGDLDGKPTLGDVASLNNISSTHISNGAVITSKLAAGAIAADKVAANAIDATHISADAITSEQLSVEAFSDPPRPKGFHYGLRS